METIADIVQEMRETFDSHECETCMANFADRIEKSYKRVVSCNRSIKDIILFVVANDACHPNDLKLLNDWLKANGFK